VYLFIDCLFFLQQFTKLNSLSEPVVSCQSDSFALIQSPDCTWHGWWLALTTNLIHTPYQYNIQSACLKP
jgi:hypothetical protein